MVGAEKASTLHLGALRPPPSPEKPTPARLAKTNTALQPAQLLHVVVPAPTEALIKVLTNHWTRLLLSSQKLGPRTRYAHTSTDKEWREDADHSACAKTQANGLRLSANLPGRPTQNHTHTQTHPGLTLDRGTQTKATEEPGTPRAMITMRQYQLACTSSVRTSWPH